MLLQWMRCLSTCAALMLVCSSVRADVPEGPPRPTPDYSTNVGHSQTNVGIYTATRVYRYRGDYNLTYNAFRIGRVGVYAFGDVDVEVRTADGEFQPDRLAGTFEIGARVPVRKSSLGVYYRHLSSHNIDLTNRPKPSWEQAGARYQWLRPQYELDLSGGFYVHDDNCRYQSDADAHLIWYATHTSRLPLTIEADLHFVGETNAGRSQYTDLWIEPNVGLSRQVTGYIGYGTVHDIDRADGRSDNPVLIGVKILT